MIQQAVCDIIGLSGSSLISSRNKSRSLHFESPTLQISRVGGIMSSKPRHKAGAPTACKWCGTVYPWTSEYFASNKNTLWGCQQPCKACLRTQYKEWYKLNSEIAKARSKRWVQAHPERGRAKSKRWADKHPEKHKATFQRWCKANPLKVRIRRHNANIKRKAKMGSGKTISADGIKLKYQQQRGKCWWCKKPLKGKYELDHCIPLARGGKHELANIVISCPTCNHRKGSKLPVEWNGTLF